MEQGDNLWQADFSKSDNPGAAMTILTDIRTARVLVIAGFLAGITSLGATAGHIGDPATLMVNAGVPTHSWHHFLRELGAQFGIMGAVLILLFVKAEQRNATLWWVMLVLLLGFYAPFWIGVPFDPAYGAPGMGAEINHLAMAVPALAGVILARRYYVGNTASAS
jgi:hypothetical protein